MMVSLVKELQQEQRLQATSAYAVCFQQEEWEEEVGLIKFTFGSENNMRSALFACFDSHGPSGVFGHELFALHTSQLPEARVLRLREIVCGTRSLRYSSLSCTRAREDKITERERGQENFGIERTRVRRGKSARGKVKRTSSGHQIGIAD
jgi:hypothetical protein